MRTRSIIQLRWNVTDGSLDFNDVHRRTFFQLLWHFVTDEVEREKLDESVSIEGAVRSNYFASFVEDLQDEMYDIANAWNARFRRYCSSSGQKGYREIMSLIFSLHYGQEFSIASSIEVSSSHHLHCTQVQLYFRQLHPREIHLCVIVRYRTKLKIPRKGVCTSYLSVLNQVRNGVMTQSRCMHSHHL